MKHTLRTPCKTTHARAHPATRAMDNCFVLVRAGQQFRPQGQCAFKVSGNVNETPSLQSLEQTKRNDASRNEIDSAAAASKKQRRAQSCFKPPGVFSVFMVKTWRPLHWHCTEWGGVLLEDSDCIVLILKLG